MPKQYLLYNYNKFMTQLEQQIPYDWIGARNYLAYSSGSVENLTVVLKPHGNDLWIFKSHHNRTQVKNDLVCIPVQYNENTGNYDIIKPEFAGSFYFSILKYKQVLQNTFEALGAKVEYNNQPFKPYISVNSVSVDLLVNQQSKAYIEKVTELPKVMAEMIVDYTEPNFAVVTMGDNNDDISGMSCELSYL